MVRLLADHSPEGQAVLFAFGSYLAACGSWFIWFLFSERRRRMTVGQLPKQDGLAYICRNDACPRALKVQHVEKGESADCPSCGWSMTWASG